MHPSRYLLSAIAGAHTLFPPSPSTTFPVRLSTTVACRSPPNILSSTLPNAPHAVTARTQMIFSLPPQARPPSRPVVVNPDNEPNGQNGSISDVRAIVSAPSTPAPSPTRVTPPLVPRGTFRNVGDMIRRGSLLERMPSSLEYVSAATAA